MKEKLLDSRGLSLALRFGCIILLAILLPILAFEMYRQDKGYAIIFIVLFALYVLPDIFIKLFRSPVYAAGDEQQLVVGYYPVGSGKIGIDEIAGYSCTIEQTNYGKKNGLLLYLKNGRHISFTEINVQAISPLKAYLDSKGIRNFGEERPGPWFAPRYSYDSENR